MKLFCIECFMQNKIHIILKAIFLIFKQKYLTKYKAISDRQDNPVLITLLLYVVGKTIIIMMMMIIMIGRECVSLNKTLFKRCCALVLTSHRDNRIKVK